MPKIPTPPLPFGGCFFAKPVQGAQLNQALPDVAQVEASGIKCLGGSEKCFLNPRDSEMFPRDAEIRPKVTSKHLDPCGLWCGLSCSRVATHLVSNMSVREGKWRLQIDPNLSHGSQPHMEAAAFFTA